MRLSKIFKWAPLLLPFFLSFYSGLIGINFGPHWDEGVHVASVTTSLKEGHLLPTTYQYPGFNYWVTLLGVMPNYIKDWKYVSKNLDYHGIRYNEYDAIKKYEKPVLDVPRDIQESHTVFRLRTIFLLVSCLSIIGTGLASWTVSGSWIVAFLGASFIASSWELAYHSRWIAPDTMTAQFGGLVVLFICLSIKKDFKWIYGAAAAAGLGFGTKYPAGLLLVPVLVTLLTLPSSKPRFSTQLTLSLKVISVFFASFFFSSPGTLLDPFRFMNDLSFVRSVYLSGENYTPQSWCWVRPGFQHLGLMLRYFGGSSFSFLPIASWSIFLFSLLGIGAGFAIERRITLALLSFLVVYIGYFSSANLMVVRNLQIILPFLALFSVLGLKFFLDRTQKLYSSIAVGVLLAIVGGNFTWLYISAFSIRNGSNIQALSQSIEYAENHPNKVFYFCPKVRTEILASGKLLPGNVRDKYTQETEIVIGYKEEIEKNTNGHGTFPSNRPNILVTWFGASEVNLNYYSPWLTPKLVAIARTKVERYHLKIPNWGN